MSAPFNLTAGLIASTEAGQRIAADSEFRIREDLAETLGRAPTSSEISATLSMILQEACVFVCKLAIEKGASDEEAAMVGRAVVEAYQASAVGPVQ